GVVLAAIWLWHQHFHVLADNLRRIIAKQAFASGVEHQDVALRINQDDSVYRGFDDGLHARGCFANDLFAAFAFGEIVNDANKNRRTFLFGFADGQIHRKDGAVLALPFYLAANADNLARAGAMVIVKIGVVL